MSTKRITDVANPPADGAAPPSDSSARDKNLPKRQKMTDGAASISTTPSRSAVFSALNEVSIPGNFCASGIASCLPTTVGLCVAGVGPIPLPMSDAHVRDLKHLSSQLQFASDDGATATTTNNSNNALLIDSGSVECRNPAWDESLSRLTRTVCLRLGLIHDQISVKLNGLFLFRGESGTGRCTGSGHKGLEDGQDVVGELLVQLPSEYTGGDVTICDVGQGTTSRRETFSLGAGVGSVSEAAFNCHYLCLYRDCEYEMGPIQSGCRTLLSYSLIHDGTPPKPSARHRRASIAPLEQLLGSLPRYERILAIPTGELYEPVALARNGIEVVPIEIRGKVEAIQAASGGTESSWKFVIANVREDSVQVVSDEQGNDVTDNATKNWFPKRNLNRKIFGFLGGRSCGDHESFILTYDEKCSFDLKCSMGVLPIEIVIGEVRKTRSNYSLLERAILAMNFNDKLKLSVDVCSALLKALHDVSTDISPYVVSKAISLFDTKHEPSKEMLDEIYKHSACFGWAVVAEAVSALLTNAEMKPGHRTIEGYVFRVGFLLQLSSDLPGQEVESISFLMDHACSIYLPSESTASASDQSWIGLLHRSIPPPPPPRPRRRFQLVEGGREIIPLPSTVSSVGPSTSDVSSAIVAMVESFGWTTLVETAVRRGLELMSGQIDPLSINDTVDLANLCLKLETEIGQAPSFLDKHLQKIVADFVAGIPDLRKKKNRYTYAPDYRWDFFPQPLDRIVLGSKKLCRGVGVQDPQNESFVVKVVSSAPITTLAVCLIPSTFMLSLLSWTLKYFHTLSLFMTMLRNPTRNDMAP